MRIKHKRTGVVLEGKFEQLENDYMERGNAFFKESLYSTEHWEEVQPRWKDVTEECEWVLHECSGLIPKWKNDWYIKHGFNRVEGHPEGYRLRKVEVWQTPHNNDVVTNRGKMTAFIVEMRND